MNTKMIGILAAAVATFASSSVVLGCSSTAAPKESEGSSSANEVGGDDGNPFTAIPLSPDGYVPALRTFNTHYLSSTIRQVCGGDYSIDMTVEFGEVTPSSMQVNAVIVYYHAAPDVTIVPTTMDIYGKEGTDVRKNDEFILGRHEGDSHRYEVNKTYQVDSGTAVVVEFHTAAGLPSGDSSDFACGQLAQAAYYPEGTM